MKLPRFFVHWKKKQLAETEARWSWVRFALVLLVMVAGMWLGLLATRNTFIQQVVAQYGYFGVFLIAFVSGFNIVVPVPAVAFVPLFLAAGMDFWTMVIVMVLGLTLADTAAFLLGKASRDLRVARESRIRKWLEKFRRRHYWAPLVIMFFFACFAPIPNEVMAIPLGFMGYPLLHAIPPLFLGHLFFTTFVAYGLAFLFRLGT